MSANGFDDGEHVNDADASDPPKGSKDEKYLMYYGIRNANVEKIIFSDVAIKRLDLKYKEIVEV